jgi:hypothetical protein
MSENANAAAASALHVLTPKIGDRILQWALTMAPRKAPVTFVARSIADEVRCSITSWVDSANADIKAAVITARSTPSSPSTIPTGTYPKTFATTSEA